MDMKRAERVESMQSSVGEAFCTSKTSTGPEPSPAYEIQIDQICICEPGAGISTTLCGPSTLITPTQTVVPASDQLFVTSRTGKENIMEVWVEVSIEWGGGFELSARVLFVRVL